jgi:hypothetical protein
MRASLERPKDYEAVHDAISAGNHAAKTKRLGNDSGVRSKSGDGVTKFNQQVADARQWFASPRFAGIGAPLFSA